MRPPIDLVDRILPINCLRDSLLFSITRHSKAARVQYTIIMTVESVRARISDARRICRISSIQYVQQ